MPPKRRQVGTQTHPLNQTSASTDAAPPAPETLGDPAEVAARLLVKRALAAVTAGLAAGSSTSVLVVVQLPAAWGEVAAVAWQAMVKPELLGSDTYHLLDSDDDAWSTWLDTELGQNTYGTGAQARFARALAMGRNSVVFATDAAILPRDIVAAADHSIAVTALTPADLSNLAHELFDVVPAAILSEHEAALVTPHLIRLARRHGQSAEAFIGKLRGLCASVGKSTGPSSAGSPRDVPTLDRLHGMAEAVTWARAVAVDLAAFKAGTLTWDAVDRGCLLSGPPGCGKTLFARAMAVTCGVPLVTGSYGIWHGSGRAHQGDLLKAMRGTFETARAQAPCLLFIDEIDSFPNRAAIRHAYAEWDTQIVNALLAEIDGIESGPGVILIGACNNPDRLDPALTRSGRLDRHIRIGLPDDRALAQMLREHLGGDLVGADLARVALIAWGSSGADCERYVRGARRRARSAGRTMVLADLVAEVVGDRRDDPAATWLAAVHEAGHAVATLRLQPGGLRAVSLRSGEQAGGFTAASGLATYFSARGVQSYMIRMLAGRAAEEVFFGEPISGAGGGQDSDLALATRLAASAALSFGLSPAVGPIWLGDPDPDEIGSVLAADRQLDKHVRSTLREAYAEACTLVRDNQGAIKAVAVALVDRISMSGSEAAEVADISSTY